MLTPLSCAACRSRSSPRALKVELRMPMLEEELRLESRGTEKLVEDLLAAASWL